MIAASKAREVARDRCCLISACLLGVHCRYDSSHNRCQEAVDFCTGRLFIPVCPEQLGGLPTPRRGAEIVGGTGHDVLAGDAAVCTKDGEELTDGFIRGAEQVLLLAKLCRAGLALFKSNSPSCGCGKIYDGSFKGRLRNGDGVATALLKAHGIAVITEIDF